ncbi:MAG: hypothetical protein ACLGIO_10985 [Acidimicrobiia bacterium]
MSAAVGTARDVVPTTASLPWTAARALVPGCRDWFAPGAGRQRGRR